MEKDKKSYVFFICLNVIVTVLSQISIISGLARPCMYALWITIPIYFIYLKKGKIALSNFSKAFILLYSIYIIFVTLSYVFVQERAWGSYGRLLLIPLLVTLVSEIASNHLSKEGLEKIAMIYLILASIFAFWVNITYYPSYSSWLTQKTYAFASKNSAAQIWASAIIISLFIIKRDSKMKKIIIYSLVVYLFIMCGITQCRTTILALVCTLLGYILFVSKRKFVFLVTIILLIIFCWNFTFTRQYIDQVLFLNKYEGADLNTYSSGRIDLYKVAWNKFCDSPIIGVGDYYIDCSYLNVLAESGLIGFIIIESIWFLRIKDNIKLISQRNNTSKLIFCLTIYYIIESILEAHPPFGPGVCSFMFWFICAFENSQYLKRATNDVIDNE